MQLTSLEVTSGVAHSHNTRQEPREATRRINNAATITSVIPWAHVPRRCLHITHCTLFGEPRLTLNIDIKVIIISFICLNMLVNIMVLALKSSAKIAEKLVIRPDYCSGKSGIPSENMGCSG